MMKSLQLRHPSDHNSKTTQYIRLDYQNDEGKMNITFTRLEPLIFCFSFTLPCSLFDTTSLVTLTTKKSLGSICKVLNQWTLLQNIVDSYVKDEPSQFQEEPVFSLLFTSLPIILDLRTSAFRIPKPKLHRKGYPIYRKDSP